MPGFAERYTQLATSSGRTSWQAPSLMMDLVKGPATDEEWAEVRDAAAARHIERFGNQLDRMGRVGDVAVRRRAQQRAMGRRGAGPAGSFDELAAMTAAEDNPSLTQRALGFAGAGIDLATGLVGKAAGAAASGIESVGLDASAPGEFVMEGLEGFEELNQRFIRRPMAQLILAGSLADSERFGGEGIVSLADTETWEKARQLSHDITPGQAFMLTFTEDIMDPDEVANYVNTDLFHYTSGTLDAVSRFFTDADVLAAKGLKAARNRYLVRPLKNHAQVDEFFRSDRWRRIDQRIQGHRQNDERSALHRIADDLFPGDDPHRLHKARFLADAPDGESRELVARALMGDMSVAQRLRDTAQRARNLRDLSEEASDLATRGRPTRLTRSGNALLDRKAAVVNDLERMQLDMGVVHAHHSPQQRMDAMFDALNDPQRWDRIEAEVRDINRMVGDLDSAAKLIGRQTEELRVTLGRRLTSASRDTAVYQTSRYRTPFRFVNPRYMHGQFRARRPHPITDVNDVNAPDQLDRMLRQAGVEEAERGRWVREMASLPEHAAGSATDRASLWDQAQERGFRKIAEDMNVPRNQIDKLLAEARKGRQRAHRHIQKQYAAGNRDFVQVDDPQHGKAWLRLPQTGSQRPQHVTAPDFGEIRKTMERAQRKGWLPQAGSAVQDMSEAMLDSVTWAWKANVLLRLAWPIRVTALDEIPRMMAKFGAATTLAEAPNVARNTVAGYMSELGLNEAKRAGRVGTVGGAAVGGLFAGLPGAAGGAVAGRGLLKTLSKVEAAGFDAPVVRGLKVPPAFGEPGDAANVFYGKVSSGGQLEAFMQAERGQLSRMRPSMRGSRTVPSDEAGHSDAWLHVLNQQWRTDPMVKKMLAGESDDDILRWFQTREGRTYLREIPDLVKHNPERWLQRFRPYVEETVPNPEMRERLLQRKLSEGDLDELAPEPHMRPDVHGASLDEASGRAGWLAFLDKHIQDAMKFMGTMPTDLLVRQPSFNILYRRALEQQIDSMGDAWKAAPDEATINRLAQNARETAQQQTRELLYDLGERREIHHMLRHVMPFAPAAQEVVTTWGKIGLENPDFAVRAAKAWTSIDEIDNLIWTDPTTDEDYLTFPVPEWARGMVNNSPIMRSALDSQGRVRMPVAGFNLVLQSPLGFGPFVQASASEIVRHRPELEEQLGIVLPYGPAQDTFDAFLSGWERRVRALWQTRNDKTENRAFYSAWTRIHQTKLAKMRQGEMEQVDFDDPAQVREFEDEVTRETRALFALRTVASFGAPSSPIFESPYHPYVTAYQQMQNQDPEHAFERFIDQYGEELADLTVGMTRSNDGIPPTMEALRSRDEFRDLIERNPEAGRFIVGTEAGTMQAEFSRAAYDYQLNTPVAPGSDEMMRERLSPDKQRTSADVRLGWTKYTRAMDWIDAERISRGLPNLQVKEAEPLMRTKRQITEQIADQHPEWAEERMTFDRDKWKGRIEWMSRVASHPEMQGRPEVAALSTYLEGREQIIGELRRREQAGEPSTLDAQANQDLARIWRQWIDQRIEEDVAFGPIYHRYLEHDPLSPDTSRQAVLEGAS